MLSPDLEQAIQQLPGERVTREYIQSRITSVSHFHPVNTLSICILQLDNGFTVTGESACVDPANYRASIGEQLAYDKAFGKCWELFGFLLAERRFTVPELPLEE